MSDRVERGVTVIKLGGSVLTGLDAYRVAAAFLADTLGRSNGGKIVAVVSAQDGHTDALAREAESISATPPGPVLDLLWSTGELRSVALLTLALGAQGVSAIGLNAHETGLRAGDSSGAIEFSLLTLRAALARHDVVIVPGFIATRAQVVLTLGRGGSDLSAVLLAHALGTSDCVLVKDVDGYFTDDPATSATAQQIERLSYQDALKKADDGCPLVQRQALDAGRRAGLSLVIKGMNGNGTIVHT